MDIVMNRLSIEFLVVFDFGGWFIAILGLLPPINN